MKNKEKLDLLLKDLSSRLPFGVKIEFGDGSIETLKGITLNATGLNLY